MTGYRLELTEWSTLGPNDAPELRGIYMTDDMQRVADVVAHRVKFHELRTGLEIRTHSYVGRIGLGHLDIHIKPKLEALTLLPLLRYAYGLREIRMLPETSAPMSELGLQELLLSLLVADLGELLRHGLLHRYVRKHVDLESPRGQIDIDELARRGGILSASLPCIVDERSQDWHLNRVLRAGVEFAASLTGDSLLRRQLHRLSNMFTAVHPIALTIHEVDAALRGLTRQTDACSSALEIIRLLLDANGVDPDDGTASRRTWGYLFDMNLFFQRLLSRFLREYLEGLTIVDEESIRGVFTYARSQNPRNRRLRSPRPDYALYRDRALLTYLDAKYRDLWETRLPTEWLYQLALYASFAPRRHSILLYATTRGGVLDQRIDIHQPIGAATPGSASVTIRPVILQEMAQALAADDVRACKRLAARMVVPLGAD